MSALTPKADIDRSASHVRFVPIADIVLRFQNLTEHELMLSGGPLVVNFSLRPRICEPRKLARPVSKRAGLLPLGLALFSAPAELAFLVRSAADTPNHIRQLGF